MGTRAMRAGCVLVTAVAVLAGLLGGPGAAVAAVADRQQDARAARSAVATLGSIAFDFTGTGINGYRQSRIRTGTGTAVRLTPGWRWQGYGPDSVLLRIEVQRDTGQGWQTVAAADRPVGQVDVVVPRFSTPLVRQTVRYRLASVAHASETGAISNTSWSPPVTVVYENQRRYTGLAKRIYGFIKPYCPGAAVRVVDQIDGVAERAGQASGGAQAILIRRSVREMPPAYQRSVALHECAHTRQWLNYGASPEGDRIRTAAEAKWFRNDSPPPGVGAPYSAPIAGSAFDPKEHAADCASIALNPSGYLGYGGWCSPAERKRGARLLAGLQYDGRPALAG